MVNKATGVLLFLFAISTLISQSAMDLFAALFVLAALTLLPNSPKFKREVLKPFGWEKLLVLLIGTFTLSMIFGRGLVSDPAWYKLFDFRWIFVAILIGAYLRFQEPSRKHLFIFAGVLIFASVYAAIIPILGFDPLEPGRRLDVFPDGTIRTGGFHKQAIVFAQLHAIWVSFFLGFFLQQLPEFKQAREDRRLYAMMTAAVLAGVIAIVLSFTRGVWIALPVSLVIMLLLRRWTWAVSALVLLGGGGLLLCLFWPAFETRILQALQGGDGERIWIWRANFEMFKDHPWFGVGYSHNVELLPEYLQKLGAPAGLIQSHAHNQFLHILVGSGIAGLLFYLTFWWILLKTSFQEMKRWHNHPIFAAVATGCLCALITFQLGGLFESNYEHSKIRYTLAMIVGFIVWLRGRENSSSPTSRL